MVTICMHVFLDCCYSSCHTTISSLYTLCLCGVQKNYTCIHRCLNTVSGFYDTANETFDPMNPNFKRLRQQQLEGERRGDKEAVRVDKGGSECGREGGREGGRGRDEGTKRR